MRHVKSEYVMLLCSQISYLHSRQVNETASHPLSVSDAAVVAVVRLEVWVSSVPPGVRVTLRSGVSQEVVCFCRVDVDGYHLCQERRQSSVGQQINFFSPVAHSFRRAATFLLDDVQQRFGLQQPWKRGGDKSC